MFAIANAVLVKKKRLKKRSAMCTYLLAARGGTMEKHRYEMKFTSVLLLFFIT